MGSFWIILIVLFVVFRRLGKRAQTENQRRKTPSGEFEDRSLPFDADTVSDYRAFREPTKESQKAPARTNRMMPEKTVISDRAQDIQERRISQHENAKKKRIHQNIHRDDEKDIEVTPSDLMHSIRDLIVCGYPTEIKEQRDFIKEGEDFLNSLSGDSLFF